MKKGRMPLMVFVTLFVLCPFLIHAQTWLGTQAGGTFDCGDTLFACGLDANFELEFLTNFINHEKT